MKLIPIPAENSLQLNKNKQPLTPDKLRELSGLEVSDEEAEEIIHSIRIFCKVLYQFTVTVKNRNKLSKVDFGNTTNIAA